MPTPLRLGTRGSLLARTQSQLIAAAIEKANADARVELIIIKTTGDQVQDKPLADVGGKGLFTKELEQALLRGEIDLAVHSYKDVPVTMPLVDQSSLTIACVPERQDARDVLVGRDGVLEIRSLPTGARVGTGSVRRRVQLLAIRPDLRVEPVRGNIDTRLRKLASGEFDAIVLAMAGLRRTGLFDEQRMTPLPVDEVTPAAGQGALALQTRRDDASTLALLRSLHEPAVAACVDLERRVVELLQGDCHSPIGAHAVVEGDRITLVACHDSGSGVRRTSGSGRASDGEALAHAAVDELLMH